MAKGNIFISAVSALIVFMATAVLAPGSYANTDQKNDEAKYDAEIYYDKIERMVPMRDGKRLFTAIYTPKDHSRKYPILFSRTPYSIGSYGADFSSLRRMAPSKDFVREGYIFVFQDIRGTYKSEGDFIISCPVRENKQDPLAIDESTDNYDSIDWLINNIKGHNGKVGQWGISYSGFTTVMGMIDPHPALAASSPQASPSDMFIGDDWHHNGAFRLMFALSWMDLTAQTRDELTTEKPEFFDYGTPWGYKFFLNAGPTDKLNEKYFGGKVPA